MDFNEFLNREMANFVRNLPVRQQPSGIPKEPIIQSDIKFLIQGDTPSAATKNRLAGSTKSNAITNAIGIR